MADKAMTEPVTITKKGRDRLVVVSAEEYERLRRRDRRAFRAEELSEADIALIAKAEMAPEHAYLDEELGDGQPWPGLRPIKQKGADKVQAHAGQRQPA